MPKAEEYYSSPLILIIQGLSYVCCFILSMVVCVPMAVHQEHFKGHCILFSTGQWQEADGQFKVDWASQAYCNFTIFVAVVTFVVTLGLGVRIFSYIKNKKDASFFAAFCEVIADGFLCLMTLIAALFITCGFKTWCGEMTRRFEYCSYAAGNPIDKADGINSSQFYFHLSTAQFAVWGMFVSTVSAFVFSTVKLCKYHHQENLIVSMAKERKRLINEDLVSEVPTVSGSASGSRSNPKHKNRRRLKEEDEEEFEEQGGEDVRHEVGHDNQISVVRPQGNEIRVEESSSGNSYYPFK